jgi:cellulose synthase/poly-beta-1,6-N-acetylglucosamine synthase-like glycosyltransferase
VSLHFESREYSSLGRIILEFFLAVITMFGLFWNTYFTMSSIFKCFIPAKAFKTNTKFFSIIPETKHPNDEWMDVTIQIPVYKESLEDVLGPTLISCIDARNHYENNTRASCNIVVCDDGMMNMLRDNFSAAEMLWENVVETQGSLDIKSLLQRVPRAARRHLLGLRSKNIIEVYNRMVFYYQNKIGFVSRSTLDRRGKFKKASNINTHLRLVFGAQNITESIGKNFEDALLEVAHNEDGSRDIMFGNNVVIGDLIVINDADARMSPSVIMTTVPEFLNNSKLGFTQHTTKTMDDQRGESCYLRLIEAYTDALYQGHFLLSSIIGCHPPLVGHSIFLRTDAVRQCGRLRMLKNAQRWLSNIGLPFVGVDQVGFENIQNEKRTEFWSESHVSEDFELMIHLYNIGYTGRYIAYPGCEFQEGVTRTFDEEAGRHRKFSLGAHELMFNPFQDWFGHGIFTPLFRNFLTCDIPSYYKIFLMSYLMSYTSGGIYLFVFSVAAAGRLLDQRDTGSLYAFNPASVLVLNIVVYYVIGYTSFLIALCRKFLYRVYPLHCLNCYNVKTHIISISPTHI